MSEVSQMGSKLIETINQKLKDGIQPKHNDLYKTTANSYFGQPKDIVDKPSDCIYKIM